MDTHNNLIGKIAAISTLFIASLLIARRGEASIVRDSERLLYPPMLPDSSDFLTKVVSGLGDIVGTMGMRQVNRALVDDPQIVAFLAVIRRGEGTSDPKGYQRLFGGGHFASFDAHPGVLVEMSGYRSTAAGAYQFLASTWEETAKIMGLSDFSPRSQDIAALGRLAYRGAVDDILSGYFESAVKKASKEWASLPFSPYGQPVIPYAVAVATFVNHGGILL